MAMEEFKKQIGALDLPAELSLRVSAGRYLPDPDVPSGYADIGSTGSWGVLATAAYPRVGVYLAISTCVKEADPALSELMLISAQDSGLEVWMREVEPEVSETLKLKLSAWVEARISDVLLRVKDSIKNNQ